jgi:glutathione peroxidase
MKLIAIACSLALAQVISASAQPATPPPPAATPAKAPNLYDIPLKDIDGKPTSLKAYKGKVLLIVNVASKCGNTPQYEGLEAMQKKYEKQGFTIVGFPCNDFAGQEPGTAEQIKEFCSSTYSVTFPLMEKLHVKGPEQHPLYTALSGKDAPFPGDVDWNFGKFIISRDGKIVKRFKANVKPDNQDLVATIEGAIAQK